MHKAADLIKKSIVQVDTGNIIGSVADLLFDPEQRQVVALITVTGGWLRNTMLVDWHAVQVWTGDVVLVQAGTEMIKASENPAFSALLERRIHLAGTDVMSRSGIKLGNVSELLLHHSGAIGAYVINRGFLGSERNYVLAEDIVALGSDALIVARDNLRDTLDDPVVAPRQTDIKRGFVMPFTGTLVQMDPDAVLPREAAPNAQLPPVADAPAPEVEVVDDPDADLPPAMRVPPADSVVDESPAMPTDQALPEIMREPEAVTGETVRLTPAEIDAIVSGEQPIPDVPAKPQE